MFLVILALHFVADFVLQSHWMASNKSRRMDALVAHVAVYAFAMMVGVQAAMALQGRDLLFGIHAAAGFFLITFCAHLATDYATSRINARLWARAMPFLTAEDRAMVPRAIRMLLLGNPIDPDEAIRLRNLAGIIVASPSARWTHWFFVSVGFDQLLHQAQLYYTALLLGIT